jgi:hypothetical protein
MVAIPRTTCLFMWGEKATFITASYYEGAILDMHHFSERTLAAAETLGEMVRQRRCR